MRRLAVALLHYPVRDGQGKVVTTAVTSVDIHDIARSARTYNVDRYYLIHPVPAARELVSHVQKSWFDRPVSPKNEARREALSRLSVVPDLDTAVREFSGFSEENSGFGVEVWGTSAQAAQVPLAIRDARRILESNGPPVMILFGTGNGLAPQALERCQAQLEPISSERESGYRHLSVRSAVAILLDRLLGARW